MSEENVVLARNADAAFNRRDVPALIEMTTDDFQWVAWPGTVQSTVYEGAEGLASYSRTPTSGRSSTWMPRYSATSATRCSWSDRSMHQAVGAAPRSGLRITPRFS